MREREEQLTENAESTKEDKPDGVKWIKSGRIIEATRGAIQVRDG